MKKTICVYCSSSSEVDEVYFEAAGQLGRKICSRDWRLIYGAGKIGLMGKLAQAAVGGNCHVTGVIPDFMHYHPITCRNSLFFAISRSYLGVL